MMSNRAKSSILVLIQFAAAFGIVAWYLIRPFDQTTLLVLGIAFIISVPSVVVMTLNHLKVRPEPANDAVLVTNGLYKFIRHPIYFSVLSSMLILTVYSSTVIAYVFWFVLLIDLIVKMKFEESLLLQKFPEYAEYMKRTKRLVPFIW